MSLSTDDMVYFDGKFNGVYNKIDSVMTDHKDHPCPNVVIHKENDHKGLTPIKICVFSAGIIAFVVAIIEAYKYFSK